jgi:hypothetical protein
MIIVMQAREMLHACSPSIPLDRASSLYCPRRYRNCSILAVHVKAADVLPGLVDVLTVASFMNEITLLIDTCIKECGLLKVTHFSGKSVLFQGCYFCFVFHVNYSNSL